ncbi:MAG TPA: glutamate synthase large subunit [Acidobacteriota bacterium]|nr:glutamate synthase large subunit [Acidobacteriota bacterium]
MSNRWRGLYRPEYEHDGCGVGFVADLSGLAKRSVVESGLEALRRIDHRGALAADGISGDGSGLMTAIPPALFGSGTAVGVVFVDEDLPQVQEAASQLAAARGLEVVEWRPVPLCVEALGELASRSQPAIFHLILKPGRTQGELARELDGNPFRGALDERNLYLLRRRLQALSGCTVPSLSGRVMVYKGLIRARDLSAFYPDLLRSEFVSHFAVFHQRFSTNTFPSWRLAQPFRMLAHNGEINTLHGNRFWWTCRESLLGNSVWGPHLDDLRPVLEAEASDSMSLDNVLEFLVLSGWDLLEAVSALVPQADQAHPDMPREVRDFYRYHACLQEPWDGPSALVFSDGIKLGAALDRNGFRPLRYQRSHDGLVLAGSEVGLFDVSPYDIAESADCRPGEMLAVDFDEGRLIHQSEILRQASSKRPWGLYLERGLRRLSVDSEPLCPSSRLPADERLRVQKAMGYSKEEWDFILDPMVETGKEPIGSMGDDTPLAVLSAQPRPLSHYFRQRFAQVTNPAMDSLRERSVMSLHSYLGPMRDPLRRTARHCEKIRLETPFVSSPMLSRLKSETPFHMLDASFGEEEGLRTALDRLRRQAEEASLRGDWLLLLSDRNIDRRRIAVPSPLALGAVHHHLHRRRLRGRVSLVCEAADVRDDHHMAVLVGYGASAVCPWLVLESLQESQAESYRCALEKGLLKIMSKMGICTLSGYQGAQVFEILGLGPQVVEECFSGTPSPIGGIGYAEIERELRVRHRQAYQDDPVRLPLGGLHRFRRGEEHHDLNPNLVKKVQAVAQGRPGAYSDFQELLKLRPPVSLRDLLDFQVEKERVIPLEEVEPADAICCRFSTAAMSLGALSPEAHETLALAMNRLGGLSNSGEGGESRQRLLSRGTEDDRNSRVKQVASGRFGVTAEYLVSADELQIKIAQGSKPGEGGHLPGHKVNDLIAELRHCRPGTELISPPPHHDIYSIEDLSQLIDDLKTVHPGARVSVKLVSESGVGTIAAGVVKAGADSVFISGHDGGTGASPRGSIKYAGTPWELGLAETHQTLTRNGLRSRSLLTVDGGLKSGRDVLMAALLGADRFGFGSVVLVAAGCVMARLCHENTCPVGVATQRPELRERFLKDPERVVNFMRSLAEEVRRLLSRLGLRSLGDAVGRTDLLRVRRIADHPRADRLDLSALLRREAEPEVRRLSEPETVSPLLSAAERVLREHAVADVALEQAQAQERVRRPAGSSAGRMVGNDQYQEPGTDSDAQRVPRSASAKPNAGSTLVSDRALPSVMPLQEAARFFFPIDNTRRSVGADLAGMLARRRLGGRRFDGAIKAYFQGVAGLSFGAFCCQGMHLTLIGSANDYVGKGMSGGTLVLRPPDGMLTAAGTHPTSCGRSIAGNTLLYGATGGEFYAAGGVGQRFAVRNSGAAAVAEGCGTHGCEYMTGGVVLILGPVGPNFAAGMTGGKAYVYDPRQQLDCNLNAGSAQAESVNAEDDCRQLHRLLRRHLRLTNSSLADLLLRHWDTQASHFRLVRPRSTQAAHDHKIPRPLAAAAGH